MFMRNRFFLIGIMGLLILLAPGCKQQNKGTAQSAEKMISAKTLGLAYLEENQLEEAETEFLKIIKMDADEVMGYANLGIVYLRMGSFEQAEEWLRKAIKMEPEDPDVRLILAKVYEMSGDSEKAISELEEIMQFSPGHVKSLYNLSELYATISGEESVQKRLDITQELAEKVPANIVPRLNLIEILILENQADPALKQMEEVQQIFPVFPKEAVEYFDQSLSSLKAGDAQRASTPFMIFHNYLKVTTPYQAGMMDLKGPGGSLVGSPVVTFDQQQMGFQAADWEEVLAAIKFTDITITAGVGFLLEKTRDGEGSLVGSTFISACDYNGDGDIDLYVGRVNPQNQNYEHYLFKNVWGVFQDVSSEAGISHKGRETSARFADYDNDGLLDLYIVTEGNDLLYKSTGEETFEEVSGKAKLSETGSGNGSLFFDYDHDGDLDLYVTRSGPNALFRNNSDGTFLHQPQSSLAGERVLSTDAGFGDFDEDGDIDLLVVNNKTSIQLFSNQRQGVFKNLTLEAGLEREEGSRALTVGDYNNDGFLDLFIASEKAGQSALYLNRGDGTFKTDEVSEELTRTLLGVKAYDASFLDFDNDGYLDLLVVGEAVKEGDQGVYLFHNDGAGKFWLSPGILPDDLKTGRKITSFDYNDDGDTDLAIVGLEGSIRLLRNDGGNNHHYIKMKLVGLRAGSAKNNYYGIGAKVEVRSGSLYQSKVVTEPNIHFGLGSREKAEVIRILWTNGVPQNMFFPATNQDLIEEQQLKGSCPFMYTWNGEEYEFVKDIMWKSALGMPLGIMGESTEYAPSGASVDYIKIPGEKLKLKNGAYSMQVTGELWEAIYVDKLELVVLDHPASVEVYVDERMGPPSHSGFSLYQVEEKRPPKAAFDGFGADLLPLITERDDRYTAGFSQGKYQGVTPMSELILHPGTIDPSEELYLYLYGWIFPSDASINASISQSDQVQMTPPLIEVINEEGEWEVLVENLSFPMGKDKMIVTDLSGKVSVSDPRIRIRTNMQLHWDQAFFSTSTPGESVESYTLKPTSADLHYRGFSRPYRKGGRYGPHWFDYATTSIDPKWRDLEGNYTRYGDVLPLLLETDDKYIIKNAGDETTIEFGAKNLPELPEGWKRDFLIHSVGWVKDGDLNTAEGQRVDPLPFHGMTRYPYGPEEAYPSDPGHQRYLREYNTREVNTELFTKAIIGKNAIFSK
jgi:tetratricopeptide (TPR) repeat protein